MAYDRYDPRDEQPRWRNNHERPERPGSRDEKGFFERAGDEIASWFGDDHDRGPDRRPGDDDRQRRAHEERGSHRDQGRDEQRDRERSRERQGREESYRGTAWPSSEREYNPSWRDELRGGRDEDRERGRQSGYRPLAGDYGRAEQRPEGRGMERSPWSDGDRQPREERSHWDRDPYRSSSRAGTRDQSDRSQDFDPHYRSWRDQHISSLDRDYDDYRREHQSKFDNDFSSWRDRRTQKRGMLGQIREHMDVVSNDDEHVGTVDKVAGERIILTKSDPESGGSHHSISCAHVERIEDNRVILECSADQARKDWRDENRSRALFEREDSGEMGNHALNRAFEGTYKK